MASKQFKLDIFSILRNISNSNIDHWDTLSDEEQKAFQPLVVMRWLSSNTAYEICMLSHLVNGYVFALDKHKKLLYQLMCISTIPNSRYSWKKRESKNLTFSKSIKLLAEYMNYSVKEAKLDFQFYTNDDMIEIANDLGYQKEFISVLKKELKVRNV